MPTYAENARQREIAARRVAQNHVLDARHAEFDLAAQDNHMKYERPSFIVVTASEAYREGWERMFGEKKSPLKPEPIVQEDGLDDG